MTSREQFIVLLSHDKPEQSDAVVLLEGDGLNRIPKACKLVKQGYAEKIVFSGGIDHASYGSFPYEKCLPLILEEGIKEEQIIRELKSQHTRDQAEFITDMCEEHGWQKILLVASHYHQYRAFLTFLKVLEERKLERHICIINVPAQPNWFEKNMWGTRIDLLNNEFAKIEHYKEKGHIATYDNAIAYFRWRNSIQTPALQ